MDESVISKSKKGCGRNNVSGDETVAKNEGRRQEQEGGTFYCFMTNSTSLPVEGFTDSRTYHHIVENDEVTQLSAVAIFTVYKCCSATNIRTRDVWNPCHQRNSVYSVQMLAPLLLLLLLLLMLLLLLLLLLLAHW